MCVSCGCGQVNDNHGDRRNITMDQVRAAAQAANTDEQTVARNIGQSIGHGARQQPQMGGQAGTGRPGQGYGGSSQGSQRGFDIGQQETDY